MFARKGDLVFELRDEIQADAFRNSEGWIVEDGVIRNDTPSDFMNPPVEDKADEKRTYTRSEITLMKTADLKELAISLGLEVTDETTGKALKEALYKELGL